MELAQVTNVSDPVVEAPALAGMYDNLSRGNVSMEQWAEGDLTEAVLARNDFAYAELFRRHFRSVTLSSQMILANVAASEDVAVDVFLDFWLKPEKFDSARGTLLSYLRMKAKGRSIDVIRSQASRSRREQHDANAGDALQLGVDGNLLSLELTSRLKGALRQLPPKEREPIELAFFGGMTYLAVAQCLGLPEGTVKARIRCGLARLRSLCAEDLAS